MDKQVISFRENWARDNLPGGFCANAQGIIDLAHEASIVPRMFTEHTVACKSYKASKSRVEVILDHLLDASLLIYHKPVNELFESMDK